MGSYQFTAALAELRNALGSKKIVDGLLSEVLDDYRHDAKTGQLDAQRLLGFAQGLMSAGLISVDDYDDVDVAIAKAMGGFHS